MKVKQTLINKDIKNYSLIKQILIGISLSSLMISQSISDGILPVTNWNLYPIPQEVASISRGGLTTDRVAISDGVGSILIYGVSGGQDETNNAPFNNLLMNNSENLNNTTLNGLILNNVISVPTNTLNDINDNIFVGGTGINIHVDGTFCDDTNPLTTGETWLNDICQGGTPISTLACANGLIEENNMCYKELATEVCGTDGSGTYNATTHMCEATTLKLDNFITNASSTLCAIDTNLNKSVCMGRNSPGQLGLGNIINPIYEMKQTLVNYSSIFGGNYSNTICGIESGTGNTYCSGWNYYGQLGHTPGTNGDLGNSPSYYNPTPIKLNINFSNLVMADYHTCGIEIGTGDTYCWGYNYYGHLGVNTNIGTNTPTPTPQKLAKKFTQLALGTQFSCGIESGTGDTYCWGDNYYGYLGISTDFHSNQIAHPFSKLALKFSKINAGGNSVCGIQDNGDTYCWGANNYGQLGNATKNDTYTPIKLANKYSEIVVSGQYTCGIELNSKLPYCAGYNGNYQLGNGTNTIYPNGTYFNAVTNALPIKKLVLNVQGAYAIGIDNNIYTWGGINPNNIKTFSKLNLNSTYEKTCEDGFELELTTGRCWQDKQ